MAIFKCKMCGGALEIASGASVIECEYCGTQQTLPKLDDDRKANMYDRANHFRRNNEFDKAMGIYENILNEDSSDAEAYWSLVLCRYGIEYVEDPSSRKRIPTVNRAQFTSIFDDDNYKSALQHADGYQKAIYEAEAKAINEIQKGILAISQKEEPFDVFICYKETDNSGRRTPDSVLANDLYHQLTQEGFKVFFSRITLEDKLGTAYEPYIFAALNSAKVMVVLGTKAEYFTAVWVKNEWSRYLALVKQSGGKKILIPAYKDMDPYDLPEEFSHLQAQDMSKLGFMQDLIRGIKKIAQADAPAPAATTIVKETVVTGGGAIGNAAALLDRGFMALEDGEWSKADGFFEEVLNQDAKCASAYLGKLMFDLKVRTRDDLKNYVNPYDENSNYRKAIRFADEAMKAELEGYLDACKKRVNITTDGIYNEATALMDTGKPREALALFAEVVDYKDARIRYAKCLSEVAEKHTIAAGDYHSVGLKYDGTVVATGGNEFDECNVSDWKDIVAVAANQNHTVGLKADSTVVAVGNNSHGCCEVSNWKDIVAIAAGRYHTVGLKADGTVVATGWNDAGQCNVSNWKNIVAVAADQSRTVGLKADSTVVATGGNEFDECNVSDWKDIVAIAAGNWHTVGLKADGTVVATGWNDVGQCNVSDWTDIVAVAAGGIFTVGLKADGTVLAVGNNYHGCCEVSNWKDIVSVAAAGSYTVGLKADSTVAAVGDNLFGQCNVSDWKNIKNQKIAAYWAKHADEKAALEEEKESLNEQISLLWSEINNISGKAEIDAIDKRIHALTSQLNSLGLFKGKQKKAIQEEIDAAYAEKDEVVHKMDAAKREIQIKIDPLQHRIKEIEAEFTKLR